MFNPDDFEIVRTPTPEPDKFTFERIMSEYKPHRIKFSTDHGPSVFFNFSDSDGATSQSESSSSSSSSEESGETMHRRDRSRKLDQLVSDLIVSSEDSLSEDDDASPSHKYSIVVDEHQRNNYRMRSVALSNTENSSCDSIVIMDDSPPSTPPLDDDDDGDEELLFDMDSFVRKMSLKREGNNKSCLV